MIKIDFFGGLHGNFLELTLNLGCFPGMFNLSSQMFDATGACHVKDFLPDYRPIIKCGHWSWEKIPFDSDDKVIRIRPDDQSMLIALVNTYLRTGGQSIDIDHLEENTISKLEAVKRNKKTTPFLETLIAEHGLKKDYPRSVLRNYFYSMFTTSKFGLDVYSYFDKDTPDFYEFPFRHFFDRTNFFMELGKVSSYLQIAFAPSTDLYCLHNTFLEMNQGWHSKLKCDNIIDHILSGRQIPIQLNIIEEAWISHCIAVLYDCAYLPILWYDQFPMDTMTITQAAAEWRRQHPNFVHIPG